MLRPPPAIPTRSKIATTFSTPPRANLHPLSTLPVHQEILITSWYIKPTDSAFHVYAALILHPEQSQLEVRQLRRLLPHLSLTYNHSRLFQSTRRTLVTKPCMNSTDDIGTKSQLPTTQYSLTSHPPQQSQLEVRQLRRPLLHLALMYTRSRLFQSTGRPLRTRNLPTTRTVPRHSNRASEQLN